MLPAKCWTWTDVGNITFARLCKARATELSRCLKNTNAWCLKTLGGKKALPTSDNAWKAIAAARECLGVFATLRLHRLAVVTREHKYFASSGLYASEVESARQDVQNRLVKTLRPMLNDMDSDTANALHQAGANNQEYKGYEFQVAHMSSEQRSHVIRLWRLEQEAKQRQEATGGIKMLETVSMRKKDGSADVEAAKAEIKEMVARHLANQKRAALLGLQQVSRTEFAQGQTKLHDDLSVLTSLGQKAGADPARVGGGATTTPAGVGQPGTYVNPVPSVAHDEGLRKEQMLCPRPVTLAVGVLVLEWMLEAVAERMRPTAFAPLRQGNIPKWVALSLNLPVVPHPPPLVALDNWPLSTCMEALRVLEDHWNTTTVSSKVLSTFFAALQRRLGVLATRDLGPEGFVLLDIPGFCNHLRANGDLVPGVAQPRVNTLLLDHLAIHLLDMRRVSIARQRLNNTPWFQHVPVPAYGSVPPGSADDDATTTPVPKGFVPDDDSVDTSGTGQTGEFVPYTDEDARVVEHLVGKGAVTHNTIVSRLFPDHTVPRALELETRKQTMAREAIRHAMPDMRDARMYRVAPPGWVKYAAANLRKHMLHSSTGTDPETFKPRQENGMVDDLIGPGSVLSYVRNIRYNKRPVQAGILRGMERGYGPYASSVQKYITGSSYPRSMDLRRKLLNIGPRGMLATYDDPLERFHVRTVVSLLECFFNPVETGLLNTFLITPNAFHTILAHVGAANGPVPPTFVANMPIIVWLHNCFWVVFLNHVAARTRNVYVALSHWMWLFVHVCQPIDNTHIRLRQSLRRRYEFLSDEICSAYARAPAREEKVEEPEASAKGTATNDIRPTKRVCIDNIKSTIDKRTKARVGSKLRLSEDTLIK